MKLTCVKVRETKNWSVYKTDDGVKSTLYFPKGSPETIVFEQVEG
jgi:hypothetical protein